VNEEDHIKVISTQEGTDLKTVFTLLGQGLESISKELQINESGFQSDEHFGNITTYLENMGTGLEAKSTLLLPKLSKALTPKQMETFAMRSGVLIRGSGSTERGSPAGPGGAWDVQFVSAQRMGKTEVELVQKMIDGVDAIVQVEMAIEKGEALDDALGKNANILDL